MKKKLIEVALPLEAINKASAREKSIRHGHPSTLHLWWARRPLAAARAVIFAQMVDDPSSYVDTLLSDPKLKRKAETALKARMKIWEEATRVADRAREAGVEAPAPGDEPTLDAIIAEQERERLFRIIEALVQWENTTNETVLQAARDEIWQSWRRACAENAGHPRAKELYDRQKLPAFHDPFAGGGSLPLEAQRLGLEAYASDLNPVAVLINKAMIEIPPKFTGRFPVNPEAQAQIPRSGGWYGHGADGLAEDVRYYGRWICEKAQQHIGHLYPSVEVSAEMAEGRPDLMPYIGQPLTVIAWLWARTVKSPNPAFSDVDVPLASTFLLGTKPGKEANVEAVVENGNYRFTVHAGLPIDAERAKRGTSAGKRRAFECLMSSAPITYDYIRSEAKAGRMGTRLMAIVAEGQRGRVYLPPSARMEAVAAQAKPVWKPDCPLPQKHRNFQPPVYGMNNLADIYSSRQLVALTTLADLVSEVRELVKRDAASVGLFDDRITLAAGGNGATAYADAVAIYLGIATARYSNACSAICSWNPGEKKEDIRFTFSRQALPMTWDFAEGNPFSKSSGNLADNFETWLYKALRFLPSLAAQGAAAQADAARQTISTDKIVSTDPPYYDNISYADLSDYFYVWLRRALRSVLPDIFATLVVPKAEELIAAPHRQGSEAAAEAFFLAGMTRAMSRLSEQTHPAFPVTIYYAFKQTENESDSASPGTGWETFLDAVIRAGFTITGTWPVRTEREGRSIGIGANALASSIVLVCRSRSAAATTATRREFVTALKTELPAALSHLQRGNIAPVDLAQAAIGPGMGVYTRFAHVLDADAKPLSVREALDLINQTLDEALAEQEGDFDADSRFALAWFEQVGFDEGEFGVADVLARAKVTSVDGLVQAGVLKAGRGKVRLLTPAELPATWDPATDVRLTAWEVVHHLIRVLGAGGEAAAAELVAKLGTKAEVARELCYRLYTLCERRKRAAEALAYNGLVQSWPEIARLAGEAGRRAPGPGDLFEEGQM